MKEFLKIDIGNNSLQWGFHATNHTWIYEFSNIWSCEKMWILDEKIDQLYEQMINMDCLKTRW